MTEKEETYSSTVRFLRKEKPELVKLFLVAFKKNFDKAVEQGLEEPEKPALMQSKIEIGLI